MTLRFGTDGIRGVANRELTVELVTALGRAAARVLGSHQPFVIGRDTRRSGPMLEAALVAGLCAEGANALLAGVVPTPAVAHLAARHGGAGAVISASHNAFADNGVKLFAPSGRKLPADAETRIEEELGRLAVDTPASVAEGSAVGVASELRAAVDEYIAHAIAALEGRTLAGLRVVIDCANGATFRTAPRVLEALGADVTVLHAAPDGTNINAGCGSMHPDDVRDDVVRTRAHAGLAFDGDGDRVIAVDEHGETVDGDQIMAILALDFHERGRLRNNSIAATVMSNLGLRRALADHGLDMIETPVGDRHVLDALEEHDLVLGGEQSGHVVIRDLATTGDGLLTGLCVLDVIFRNRRRLSHLAAVVKRYPQAQRNVRVADREALDRDRRFWHSARQVAEQLGDEGRVLVRPSGTEPMVRIMVEAPSAAQADEVADWLAAAVQEACGAAAPPS